MTGPKYIRFDNGNLQRETVTGLVSVCKLMFISRSTPSYTRRWQTSFKLSMRFKESWGVGEKGEEPGWLLKDVMPGSQSFSEKVLDTRN